jgi:hypothetical protein
MVDSGEAGVNRMTRRDSHIIDDGMLSPPLSGSILERNPEN